MATPADRPELNTETIQSLLENRQRLATLPEADQKEATALLETALNRLREAERLERQTSAYALAEPATPAAQTEQAQPFEHYLQPQALIPPSQAPTASIEQAASRIRADVIALKATVSTLRTKIDDERVMDLPALIAQAQQQAINTPAPRDQANALPDSNPLEQAVQLAEQAEHKRRLAQITELRERLATKPARISRMEEIADLLEQRLNTALELQRTLENRLDRKRLQAVDSRTTRLELIQQRAREQAPPLEAAARQNVTLSESIEAVIRSNQADQVRQSELNQRISTLESKFNSLNKLLQLRRFESSVPFGVALRREWDKVSERLVSTSSTKAITRALTTSRVTLFDLQEHQGLFEALDPAQLAALAPAADTKLIDRLVADRKSLTEAAAKAQQERIDGLSTHLAQLQRYAERSETYTALLKSHLFWIPSAKTIGPDAFEGASNSISWLIAPERWETIQQSVQKTLSTQLIWVALLLSALILSVVVRPSLKRRLGDLAPLVGKVQHDRFNLTLSALTITVGLAAPMPLAFLLAAQTIGKTSGFPDSLHYALLTGASALAFMEFILQLVRTNGLAEIHFKWRAETLALLRHHNRWLITLLVPIVVVMVLLENQATPEIRDGLGRFTLVVMCFAIAITAYRLGAFWQRQTHAANSDSWQWLRLSPRNPIFTLFPLSLAGLSMLGYHYTATVMLELSLRSAVYIALAVLVYYIAERSLAIYERRLALQRLLAQRAEAFARNADRDTAEKAGEDIPEIIDSQVIDRQTITNQTKSLLRLFVWAGLVVALSSLWRDLLPVVRSLDDQVLWQIAASQEGQPIERITLWNLSIAALVLVATFLGVRNLPGALEVALLSRIQLTPGTGYAITTVLKYLLVFAGVITALNLLGTDWSKLQWLVAALGVGLGFGLQEIVANFVSGIVILFEKPFRLGDTITIGDQSGTVTRIQIRATTLSDWDRKEIIIPNKTFITGQFVNWTLADAVTRLVIPVGVAYGTDTQKVVQILTDVAVSNDRVLADPTPAILFINFGASSLDFEMRVFSKSIVDRVLLTHELHMAITQAFEQSGIQIAFPQLDVHLDPKPET